MSFSAVARDLRAAREALMERWQRAVHRDAACLPSAQDLPKLQLWDHLPELLEEIAAAVEGAPTLAVEDGGRAHGRSRWTSGYDIPEVVRELAILRETLLEWIEEYSLTVAALTARELMEVCRRIHRVIDHSAQAGVAQFYTEALAVRRELWTELEAANVQLKAANDQKDRFFALLSHELRNPLAPILTAVQLLEFSDATDPRLRRAREVIERQVKHQARLIDDLLDVSRIAQGKMALRLEPHNLKAAVAYAVEGCLSAIEAKDQELRVDLPDEPLPVQADPVRLEQIVTNLLSNANRYTDPGGTIWLTVARVENGALIRVRDTGIGIAPELLPRIFELFVQADTSQHRPRGGLGIGLALVRHLVELHGGTVEADSPGLGQGTEFTVRLPLMAAGAAPPALHLEAPARTASKRPVALVEDNPDSRAVLAELLEVLGYQVVTAANGSEALRLARENGPNAFVIDIGLPGMDGYEVARRLRQAPGGKDLLLIALTGYGGKEERERAREAGFDAHLTKPADIDALERLLAATPERRNV